MSIVFSCLGLLSCIELCIFCVVLYSLLVLLPSDWLGRLTLVISFMSKGFPNKDQIEELFIVMVYCMYSQHITLSAFSLLSLF